MRRLIVLSVLGLLSMGVLYACDTEECVSISDNSDLLDEVLIPEDDSLVESISRELEIKRQLCSTDELLIEKAEKRRIAKERELELARLEKERLERESKPKGKPIQMTLTFYTDLECENGKGLGGMNAIGGRLTPGKSIAVPRNVAMGSVIEVKGYGTRVADDVGSPKHIRWVDKAETHMRADIFIGRNKGESDSSYKKRVNSMGKVKTTGYLYIKQ